MQNANQQPASPDKEITGQIWRTPLKIVAGLEAADRLPTTTKAQLPESQHSDMPGSCESISWQYCSELGPCEA